MSTELQSALEAAGVHLTPAQLEGGGEGWSARVRTGLRERKALLDLRGLSRQASENEAERRRQCASYARGVYGVLCEPGRSDAHDWEFTSAARALLPSLEGPWFSRGVRDASGEGAALQPFADGVVVAHVIELDEGYHVVTQAQVDAWGATPDRIHKAAVSILFHRTSFGCFVDVDGEAGVEALAMRDGFDAARALILDLWDWERTRDGCLFALPSPERLLVSNATDDDARARLRDLATREYDAAAEPLSARVFAFEKGTRVAEPVL